MKIGIIGLGEAGGYYAMGLAQGGAVVRGYDRSLDNPQKAEYFARCRDAGVQLCGTIPEVVKDADLVLAVTVARVAVETAERAMDALRPGQIYVEMNSAVPAVKERIRQMLSDRCEVVDGTTMASVNQLHHKTPVNLSGPCAQTVSETLNRYGMNTRCIGTEVGQASALKVTRSIFMKGLEAILMESLLAADAYGLSEQVMDSILEFFETKPVPELMNMLVTTDSIHCGRRAAEMEQIAGMLRNAGIEHTMTNAAAEKLRWVESFQLEQVFDGRVPAQYGMVLDMLSKLKGGQK